MGRSRARSTSHRPTQQAQPIGPVVTQSMSDFTRPPDTRARFMFLLALRRVPVFWETLHAGVWKAGTPEALIWWAAKWNVVDDWLLDVVRDTLEYWESEPGSPDAMLDPAYKWFVYRPLLQQDQKPFQLVLENPRPIRGELAIPLREDWAQLLPVPCLHRSVPDARNREVAAALESGQHESIEDFKARVLRTCEEQLRDYEKDFHRRFTFEREPEMAKHALWTVARFCGKGYVQIADATPGMRYGPAMYPNKAVTIGVQRFAERIGLTLAKKR